MKGTSRVFAAIAVKARFLCHPRPLKKCENRLIPVAALRQVTVKGTNCSLHLNSIE